MSVRIVFTGGGTAGHVTPNFAVIELLQAENWSIDYIGSVMGIEKEMVSRLNIPYHAVSGGKLRRYFSWQNFLDPIKIVLGIIQSYFLLRRLKTNVVFSKGGFVAFPVVVAAWLNRIPVVGHESDMTPGLANRLSFPFLDKLCVTFAETKQKFKKQDKIEVTGALIRQVLFSGSRLKGLALCHFTSDKLCLLIMGGGQGSMVLNQAVREALPSLCQTYQVIHLCGKGKLEKSLEGQPDYCQFEYADVELPDLFAASDCVVSRSGSNALFEILALKKPHILVPLSASVSRGDQILNAQYFEKQGISLVIDNEQLRVDTLLHAVNELSQRREAIIMKLNELHLESAAPKIVTILKQKTDAMGFKF